MADVDTSLYPKAPANPFETLSAAAGAMGNMAQARQLQMTLAAKQAIGPMYQKHLKPDGTLDYAGLINEVNSNPATAFIAPDVVKSLQDRQRAEIDIASSRQNLRGLNAAAAGAVLQPVLATKRDANGNFTGTYDDVTNALRDGFVSDRIDEGTLVNLMRSAPRDPKQLQGWLENMAQAGMTPGERAGTPISLDTGAGKQTAVVPPYGPARAVPGTAVPNLDTTVVPKPGDPTRSVVVTKAQAAQMAQGGAAPAAPAVPGAPTPARTPGIEGPTPGEIEAEKASRQPAGELLASLRADVPNTTMNIQQLKTALDLSRHVKTGAGAESINEVKSFLLANAPAPVAHLIDAEGVKNFDELNKILKRYTGTGGGISAHTDEQLKFAMGANPSVQTSQLAVPDMVRYLIGVERYKRTLLTAFEKSGRPDSEFSKFTSDWSQSFNPQSLVVDLLSPQERAQLKQRVGAKGWASLNASAQRLKDLGLWRRD